MKVWIVIIPQDYSTADAVVFRSKQKALEYKKERGESERDGEHYITVTQQTL